MPEFIQIVPVESQGGMPMGFFGLEEGGRVWYGKPEFTGKADGGPDAIRWRILGEQ